jgi:hypothetical protein
MSNFLEPDGVEQQQYQSLIGAMHWALIYYYINHGNLYHDMITGHSVTWILHLANKMTNDWYFKKRANVETAMYESEFCAARTCTEPIIDLCTTLHYLGVCFGKRSYKI